MAYPTLTPSSTTSVSRLPVTGNVDNVNATDNPLPYGVYITNARSGSALTGFKQGAADLGKCSRIEHGIFQFGRRTR